MAFLCGSTKDKSWNIPTTVAAITRLQQTHNFVSAYHGSETTLASWAVGIVIEGRRSGIILLYKRERNSLGLVTIRRVCPKRRQKKKKTLIEKALLNTSKSSIEVDSVTMIQRQKTFTKDCFASLSSPDNSYGPLQTHI